MTLHLPKPTPRATANGLSRPARLRGVGGFSLVELLVSMTILAFLMVIIASVTNQASVTVRSASALIDASQSGRSGFDIITQKLSQATLNTYLDYDSPTAPTKYVRKSDLHFLVTQNANGSGHDLHFQAPTAYSQTPSYGDTQGLLNAFGFFVQYGNDDAFRPGKIAKQRWRYRLMQGMQPTENLTIFSDPTNGWTTAVDAAAWPIADNIIALIVWPRLPTSEDAAGTSVTSNYLYDSRNAGSASVQYAQIAPVIQVTLVMIDEAAAVRLDTHSSTPPVAIKNALAASPFTDVTKYQTDLTALQTALTVAHINYQVLTTTVAVRESKWSSTP